MNFTFDQIKGKKIILEKGLVAFEQDNSSSLINFYGKKFQFSFRFYYFLLKNACSCKNKSSIDYLLNNPELMKSDRLHLQFLLVNHFSRKGFFEEVLFLIEYCGISSDLVSVDTNYTSLHTACRYFDSEYEEDYFNTIVCLVENAKDRKKIVNFQCKKGRSPFHLACQYCSLEIVTYLFEREEADIFLFDSDGLLPVDLAYIEGNMAVYNYLKDFYR